MSTGEEVAAVVRRNGSDLDALLSARSPDFLNIVLEKGSFNCGKDIADTAMQIDIDSPMRDNAIVETELEEILIREIPC